LHPKEGGMQIPPSFNYPDRMVIAALAGIRYLQSVLVPVVRRGDGMGNVLRRHLILFAGEKDFEKAHCPVDRHFPKNPMSGSG